MYMFRPPPPPRGVCDHGMAMIPWALGFPKVCSFYQWRNINLESSDDYKLWAAFILEAST